MRILTVSILAALAAAAAFAADEIPPSLKKEAQKVFAADKTYFIWVKDEQPVKGVVLEPLGSMAFFTVHFAARTPTNTPPFRIKTELMVVGLDNKTITPFITTAPGTNEAFAGKPLGDHITGTGPQHMALSGSGTAKVRLISADNKAADDKAISNTLDLKVEFTDKK